MLYKKLFLICAFVNIVNLYADECHIDNMHDKTSDAVFFLSTSIDKLLSQRYNDTNISRNKFKRDNKIGSADAFFKTNKFIDETEKTFLRINFNTHIQSKGSNDFKYKVRARLPLSRTKKSFNLFIDDLTDKTPNTEITNKSSTETPTTSVGINYFAPETYGIESKYSLGASGFHPYVRARYHIDYTYKSWDIEPVQIFRYSTNRKFEEETSIFFDKKIQKNNLLRFILYRHTQEKKEGMDYAFTSQYFHQFQNNLAISLSQTFTGHTKYEYFPNNTLIPTKYSGINNYTTTVNIRKNVWRKWLYYEISPGVNFHKQNDFEANYFIAFSIDIYFGHSYKTNSL